MALRTGLDRLSEKQGKCQDLNCGEKKAFAYFLLGFFPIKNTCGGIVKLCDWRCLFTKNSLAKRMKNTYKIGKTLQAEMAIEMLKCRGVVGRGL